MDMSDDNTGTSESGAPASRLANNRRTSGRVKRKPDTFSPNLLNGKRKRANNAEDGREGVDMEDSEEDSEDEDSGSADDEEIKEKKRKTSKKSRSGKPASKKPRTSNGTSARKSGGKTLAHRPAARRTRARHSDVDEDAQGLYGTQTLEVFLDSRNLANADGELTAEVFARGRTAESVAAEWVSSYERHNSRAIRDLVNFVLKSSGCNLEVTEYDIEDPDHVTDKLADLQDEYQAQNITEYPLISKAKSSNQFRQTFVGFLDTVVSTIDASSVLYDDLALIENFQIWVTTMTSSSIRPFRHTATVVSLALVSSLCEVAATVSNNASTTLRQMEAEKKKGRVNKGRVADLQKNLDATNKKRETLDSIIKDIFDTVFVHRYRDVDPKIRVDCIQALGLWITTLPDIFFEGTYLRYMGWVLSDTSGQTRAEVVRQLQRLFNDKDNIAGLRTFTERFRPRLVEMATRDADINVRVLAIELLDSVRDAGFLEPDDIDVIGKLLFDSEPRVRKAVAGFFVENIQDLYDTKIDELGGEEAVEEALARDDEEDYDHPRLSWIKLKCLVEVLQAYDSEDDDLEINEAGFLVATGVESRFALAAQALYDKVPEIKEWEVLAGYILYDHSETSSKPRKKDDVEKVLKRECKLDEQEEIVLLEVLNAVVTLSILHAEGIDPSKKGKKTKALRTEATESGEAITRHLADLIPRLLNKFGALPAAASIVLRLEHALNLEVFHQLRQDTTYAALLDDINKQFLSHGNQSVLAEASAALLHAKGFEDLEEVTEEKVQHLWQDTTQTLQALVTGQNLQERGNMTSIILSGLTSTVRRISNLASVSDCIEVFEKIPSSSSKRRKTGDRNSPPLQSLINLVSRGILSNDDMLDEEVEALEEDLSSTAMQAVLFYFMWKVRSLQAGSPAGTAVSSEGTSTLNSFRKEFSETLHNILETRSTTDTVRVNAAGTLLDLHTLFATLRHFRTSAAPSDPMSVLITQISHGSTEQLTSLFTSLEKAYSKKAHRSLEQPADDDEPEDLEASDDEDEDDADETQKAANSVLAAEQRLCEYTAKLVLAIIARVLDTEGDSKQKQKLRKRLERNKGRLGPNFKEVIAHLEQADGKKRPKKGIRGRGPAESARATSKSAAKVVESEGEGEGEDEDDPIEEGGEEDLRRRELLVEDEVEPDSPEPELQDEIEDEIMGD